MNNAFRARGIQTLGHLNRNLQYPFQFHRATPDSMFQGLPFQKFHGDKRSAALLADVVNGADIRMIECRGGFCLTSKPLHGLAIPCYVVW